jgi:hypothetical protein
MSTLTIQVPDSVRRHVERLSLEDGVSVDQFFATAAAEKVAVLEAVDYIRARANRADDAEFERVLAKIPDTEPVEDWDRMP